MKMLPKPYPEVEAAFKHLTTNNDMQAIMTWVSDCLGKSREKLDLAIEERDVRRYQGANQVLMDLLEMWKISHTLR